MVCKCHAESSVFIVPNEFINLGSVRLKKQDWCFIYSFNKPGYYMCGVDSTLSVHRKLWTVCQRHNAEVEGNRLLCV